MIGTVAQKLGALLFADCQQTIDIVVAEHFGHGRIRYCLERGDECRIHPRGNQLFVSSSNHQYEGYLLQQHVGSDSHFALLGGVSPTRG